MTYEQERCLCLYLSSAVFERAYPRFPTVDEIDVSETDRGCWLDLRPYADTGPVTIQDCASIQRTYRVFRTLGLRHLVVVDAGNKVRGIITQGPRPPTRRRKTAWSGHRTRRVNPASRWKRTVDHGALQRRVRRKGLSSVSFASSGGKPFVV